MKAKGGEAPATVAAAPDMEQPRLCGNCERWVSGANLSLHEAHCLRFLALCPECREPVARKEMQEHLQDQHRQVRCRLCHGALQRYQMEEHASEQCPERMGACPFCQLELPFRRLGPHRESCGARTTKCWDCGKYVMFRALEDHQQQCQLRPEAKAIWVPEQEPLLQPTDECCPLPQLLGALSTGCPPGPGPSPSPSPCGPPNEKGARPKRKDKALPAILEKPSLKPPRSKKALSLLAFAPNAVAPPQAPQEEEEEGTVANKAYDRLASCPHCHILLPGPTLQKHQKKCQRLQAQCQRRRSPRFLDKGEAPQMPSPSGEKSWQ